MKLSELEKILQKLTQLCNEIKENDYSTESVENAMLDNHFYNLLTSTFVDTQHYLEDCPKLMHELSIELAKTIHTDKNEVSYLVDSIANDAYLVRSNIEESTFYKKSKNISELKLFVESGKVPEGWETGTGICAKCCSQLKNPFISDIACSIVQMEKPFIASHYPIQNNSKGIVNSEYMYINNLGKYEGEQLLLRIEFTKSIIELIKSQTSTED